MKRPIRLPPQLSRFFDDRNPDMNARAVHGLASCKEYFIFRNSGRLLYLSASLQFSPRVDACWTPDRLHVSGSGADDIPIQEPPQVMAKSPQALSTLNVAHFEPQGRCMSLHSMRHTPTAQTSVTEMPHGICLQFFLLLEGVPMTHLGGYVWQAPLKTTSSTILTNPKSLSSEDQI